MRGLFAFGVFAVGAAILASGCRRNLVGQDAAQTRVDADDRSDAPLETNTDHSPACYPLFHACTVTEECCAPNRCLDITGTPACQQEGPAIDAEARIDLSLPPGIPKADPDGGTCSQHPGESLGVVCFGSDPSPYQQYLKPVDGGAASGSCPAMSDFIPVRGESCGYVSCGPLLGSAVAEMPDAGAIVGDAGIACCFLVARVCGV